MVEYLGYYAYEIPVRERTRLMNASVQRGITLYHMKEAGEVICFRIPLWKTASADAMLASENISYCKGKTEGLIGSVAKVRNHPGFLVGLFLAVVLYIWLGSMVWEVRVISRSDVDEDRVLQLLAECGLHEGTRLSKLNEDEIVADYLLRDEGVAFAAVHLRGVVAEVEIIPYEVKEEPEIKGEPCNIVASEDALITDLTIYAGRAMVKVGETVRAGDILVSGVVTDVGGTRLVHAAADVRGERRGSITVTSPVRVTDTVVSDRRVTGADICIFGKTFHIPLPGKRQEGCTVKEKRRLYLFGTVRLPIEVTAYTTYMTADKERDLTDEATIAYAYAMLEEEIDRLIGDGTLLSIEKKGDKTEAGYVLTAQIVFENNIGKTLAFGMEKQ